MPSIQSHNDCPTISDSLEQLVAASERLASFAADAASLGTYGARGQAEVNKAPSLEAARHILLTIFDANTIAGYDGSPAMEKARVAHFNAAMEMYGVVADDQSLFTSGLNSQSAIEHEQFASRIGQALLKELLEFYSSTLHGNDRVIFTTEQRTALESAFLLKQKLNMAEKRALARTCNLNPRQVEVWFSNRRTRKKREERRITHQSAEKRRMSEPAGHRTLNHKEA